MDRNFLTKPFATAYLQAKRSPRVDGVKRGAVQSRNVGPNFLASAHQRVGEMAISLRVTRKQFTIELQDRGRIEEIEAILLQDWLEQHDPPAPFALFQKEVEAAGTDHIT